MNIRKINSKITGILIITVLAHYGICLYSLSFGWYNPLVTKITAIAPCVVFVAHALLSLYKLLFVHDKVKGFCYPKYNIKTLIQRISAILMVITLPFHIKAFPLMFAGLFLFWPDRMALVAIELIFFLTMFVHMAISIPRACITFGDIRFDETEKKIQTISYIACAILFLAGCFVVCGFILIYQP